MNIMQVLKEFFPELMIAGAAVILIVNAVKKAPLSDSLRWIAIAMLYTAVLMRKDENEA
jgi:hypothetical protein